jgi:hypothetical protein
MTITFRPAVREGVPLLLGLAGGTGSGKTWSAMVLAKGLAGDKPFAVVDTENGRAKHYADDFRFDVTDLHAPCVPKPIKLPEQLKPFLPLDRPIGEEAGVRLAQWAAGDAAADPSPEEAGLADELLELADALGKREETAGRINQHRATDPAGHAEWLRAQITRARQASENREKQPELA